MLDIMHQQKRYLVRKARKSPVLRGFFAFLGNFGLCQQKSQTVDISTLFFGSNGTWTQTVKFFEDEALFYNFIINRRMRIFFASKQRGEWKALIRLFCFSKSKIRKERIEKDGRNRSVPLFAVLCGGKSRKGFMGGELPCKSGVRGIHPKDDSRKFWRNAFVG